MAWQIAQSLVYQTSKVYVDTLNFKEDSVHLTIPALDLKMCKKYIQVLKGCSIPARNDFAKDEKHRP